jgi:hypothetical protein
VAEHTLPQLIPAGLDVTVPLPLPCRSTESVTEDWSAVTVRTVLALEPSLSVTPITVDPALTPRARPFASIVATLLSLVVHVTPVRLIATGVSALLVLRSPSWP